MFKGFLVCLFFVAVFALVQFAPEMVLAQTESFTPESVGVTELVKFDGDGGVLTAIKSPLAKILAGAIGIGIAVWVARYFFKIVKSMGR
jgi:cytochrome b